MKKLVVLCATCGVGKTTVKDYLNTHSKTNSFVFFDTDEIGLNWHDYEDLEDANIKFAKAGLTIASEKAGDKNILWATCMNPMDYREKIAPISGIGETYFINLQCSDEALTTRLKGRPVERMTHTDEFIATQVEYMNWFRRNTYRMNLVIDSTELTIAETAEKVEAFLKSLES